MFIPVRLCRNSCMSVIPILAITTDIHYSVQIDSDMLWFKLFLISHAWMHHNMFGIKWKQIKYPKWWAQYHYSCFFFDENKFLRNRVSFILGRTVYICMKSLFAKTDKSIYVKWRYLRLKIKKNKENNKNFGDSFDHNFKNIPI